MSGGWVSRMVVRARRVWRQGLPNELVRTRRRFTLLSSAIALAGLAIALAASFDSVAAQASRADIDALQMQDALVKLADDAPELQVPARDDYDAPPTRLNPERLDALAAQGDPTVFRSVFHLVIYRSGSVRLLSGHEHLNEAREFLAASGWDFPADSWHGASGGGEIYTDRQWVYGWAPLTEAELREMAQDGVMLSDVRASGGDASDPFVPAALYTVLDATPTRVFTQRVRHSMAMTWLMSAVPVIIACHLLARLAMRPAARAWQRQSAFVTDASHELKTPLAALSLDVDALAAHPEATVASQDRWLGYMRREIDEMGRLVFALLEDARADADLERMGGSAAKEPCDAPEVAGAAVERARARFGRGASLSCEDGVGPVSCSGRALGGILDELLGNAVSFSDEDDQVSVRVWTAGRREVAISVTNTGPGIAAEDLPHVFERFYQADAARTRGDDERAGFGLGLAIARRRARACGGDIRVESVPGETTTFTVTVPAARER